ncbi:MAG: sulfatase [Thermoanaerobaculia bacterium]
MPVIFRLLGTVRVRAAVAVELSLCLLIALLAIGCRPDAPPPNVILISLDTLRADHVGAAGYSRDTTPNLDRLAAEGTLFLNNYSQAPNTAPSHTSILTSLYPSVHGVFKHGQVLDPEVETLPEVFQQAGYRTAAFTQLNGETYKQGFDRYHILESPPNAGKGLKDTQVIQEWISKSLDQPFFLFVHSYDVHLPYSPPKNFIDRFAPGYDGPLPVWIQREDINRINHGQLELAARDYQYIDDLYDAELFRADEILGTLFDHVREAGIWDETVIVVLSDHGEEFGEHGLYGRHTYSLYNELLRTPLILRGPGVPVGGKVTNPSRNIDVAPTLMRLAGLKPPESFMGDDLRPVWKGREREPREVVAERRVDRILIRNNYKYFSDGRLFDLSLDPTEQTDIAANHPEIALEMQEGLDGWIRRFVERQKEVASSAEILLTGEEEQRLRALGYLD